MAVNMERQIPLPTINLDTSMINEAPSSRPSDSDRLQTPETSNPDGTAAFLSPTTPTRSNYDGITLHSRSPSVLSNSASRFRSNSASTFVTDSGLNSLDLEDALTPDPGNEKDFKVNANPFAFSPGQLNKLLNPKSLAAFAALGGPQGLEKGLRTNFESGLSADECSLDGQVSFANATTKDLKSTFSDVSLEATHSSPPSSSNQNRFQDRLRVYKDNRLPERKPDSIFKLIWRAYNDKILILLTIAAVISLALGIYETLSGGDGADWVEGVAICVAIIIVVTVGALNDYQKERQFAKLNKRKDDREVKVIRSGKTTQISVFDIMVGDVMHLEPGDAVPADGIFLSGHGVKCDESSATGESDQMKKVPAHEVWARLQDGSAVNKLDPFIISGSKVLEGVGTFVVTSVGVNSSFGKIMMSLQTDSEETPLQVKLGRLANWIGGLGSAAAGLLFMVLLIKFLAGLSGNTASGEVKAQEFVDILIVAITVIVVAVPEGLPLAVTLALAFATTQMYKENNLVRLLRACETMGNATTICSDKTGTLTQNKMTVVVGTVGTEDKFAEDGSAKSCGNFFDGMSKPLRELIRHSVAINSTAFEGEDGGNLTFIGSKTETALLHMAKSYTGLDNLAAERSNIKVVQLIPFDSKRKCMAVVVKVNGVYRLLVKGAAEIMLRHAPNTVSGISNDDFSVRALRAEDREMLEAGIEAYAQQSLRTIGLLYKDYESWPPTGAKTLEDDKSAADFDDVFHDMTWIGVVGIHDPLRPGVTEAVSQCRSSGVVVRMVTGDNITTARAIAISCGILDENEDAVVMEGPKFRQLSDADMDKVIPRLRVLARSSPEDKRVLVARLKAVGETVAVTGDGTNDGPALKMADVGFSMGIAGTEVAKEASSIILLDDNFASTITALMWGRAVNDAVKKFLQFQITVNITAVILTFISAVSSSDNSSVLTAVQLLWVNLIMDTLAALALATDPPTKKILDRPPQPKSERLITHNMWKMILGQAVYQLVVTFVLYFAGMSILNYDASQSRELDTIVFNTFVWMQIFNEFNNRRLDNKFNVFEGMLRNYWFLGINVIMVAGQIMIIFVGGEAFRITRLNGGQWAISILCALPCMLWAMLIRLVPDNKFGVAFDATVDAVSFVLSPVQKGLHFVLHPVAACYRSVRSYVKRTLRRENADHHEEQDIDDARLPDVEMGFSRTTPKDVAASEEGEQPDNRALPTFTIDEHR